MEERFISQPYIRVSFVLHALVMVLLWALTVLFQRPQTNPSTTLLIEIDNDASRLIVNSDKGDKTAPDPKAYLGKENRRVQKQTVAKGQDGAAQVASSAPAAGKTIPLSKLGVALPTPQGEKAKVSPVQRDWSMFKQVQVTEKRSEYVKGVQEGSETALNTREYVFFTYFERIRSQLDQAWKPLLREHLLKLYKTGRELASNHDHITRLTVTLDSRGEVTAVRIVQPSGTMNLDSAAVDAFNRAGPFPNPPKGLLGAAGSVDIRWDFILKT